MGRLVRHDMLVPFLLAIPVFLALGLTKDELGLSDDALSWLMFGAAMGLGLLSAVMYELGRGRDERRGSSRTTH